MKMVFEKTSSDLPSCYFVVTVFTHALQECIIPDIFFEVRHYRSLVDIF